MNHLSIKSPDLRDFKKSMNDIRYVCISDIHLGEGDSLLTSLNGSDVNPSMASPVMIHLVLCLRELISKNEGDKKPTLILNGDILELALAEIDSSAMAFERFMELVMTAGEDLFERIIYVPGNHDHHIWELARETQYVQYILRHPDKQLYPPWHKTEMFLEAPGNPVKHPVPSYFLNSLIERRSQLDMPKLRENIDVQVAYPNLGILSDDGKKCVVFHHGHFVESKYWLMSKLKADLMGLDEEMPGDVQIIESENFAWIDFLWSALGRSGEVGALTETLYEHMLDRDHMRIFISQIADNLARKYDLPGQGDWMEAEILNGILSFAFNKIAGGERGIPDEPLGVKTEEGMALYLRAVWNQIIHERKGEVPSELAFVFGHTHKPFQRVYSVEGLNKPVAVYNTGGWVIDKVKREKVFGGAVMLLDGMLDGCMIEMYRQFDDPDDYRVRVRYLNEGIIENSFGVRISNLVDDAGGPWKRFSNIIYADVEDRAERLGKRLRSL